MVRLKLDLHVHSKYSSDSSSTFEGINRRCRELGLDGYALCDHDSIDGLAEAGEKSCGLVVVPCLEVTARGAHILCLEPSSLVPSGFSIVDTVGQIHGRGGTAILAHPYAIPRSFVRFAEAEKAGFDAIEVANSAQIPFGVVTGWNRGMAERLGLPQTGGSDAHIPELVGRSYTVVEADSREPRDVVDAIRGGRTEVVGAGFGLFERMLKSWRAHAEDQ